MNIRCMGIKILLAAFIFSALMFTASAASFDPWISSGDGYVVNNVCIDVSAIGINDDDPRDPDKDSVQISVYEWKNNSWTRINTSSVRMNRNGSTNFTAADGNYTVKALDIRDGLPGSARLEIWTNANVTNNGSVPGGSKNAEGVGKAELKITKTASGQSIYVGETVNVTIFIENVGKYDANVTGINDNVQYPLVVVNTITSNTYQQTLTPGENRTVLVYELRIMEPGSYTLGNVSVNVTNKVGVQGDSNHTALPKIEVIEMPALEFTNQIASGTVDHYTQSKLHGTLTIRNTGTLRAEHIHIDFPLPQNAKLDGKDIGGLDHKKTFEVDMIMPNNEVIIPYTVTATTPGYYEITPEYTYLYNGSSKTGEVDKITYRAAGNKQITTLLDIWYVFVILGILILVAVLFVLKRHREYKF